MSNESNNPNPMPAGAPVVLFAPDQRVAGGAVLVDDNGNLLTTSNGQLQLTISNLGAAKSGANSDITSLTGLTTPLVMAAVNNAIKSKFFTAAIAGGSALADTTTYTHVIAPVKAGTIKSISIAAHVVPASGTNTVTISVGETTLLSTANFDPTTITTPDVSQALTLTATTGNLTLTANQTITVVWVAGTQGTAAVAPVVVVEYQDADY